MKTFRAIFPFFISFVLGTVHLSPQNISNDSLNRIDAITLCLRMQKEGVFIDSTLLAKISSALEKARATRDTLKTIHAFKDYVQNQLIVGSSAPWTQQWKNGSILTGYSPIDSLLQQYHVTSIESHSDWFLLKFAQTIHAPNLRKLFERDSSISYAEPNSMCCDGNNIEMIFRDGEWGFGFSYGDGDCPAGCIYRYYWYVSVVESTATFIEGSVRNFNDGKIFRWLIPERVKPKAYSSMQEMIDASKYEKTWWLKKHAVMSLSEIFKQQPPNTDPKILELQNEAITRKKEIFDILQNHIHDSDIEISTSAIYGLGSLITDYTGFTSYFPLKKGNEIYYTDNSGQDPSTFGFWKVTKDTALGSYAQNVVIDDQILFHRKLIVLKYLSINTVKYLELDKKYQVLIDFTADEGSSWDVYFSDKKYRLKLCSKNDSISTFTHCYSFEIFDSTNWNVPLHKVWMAPGFGIVARKSNVIGVPPLFITNKSKLGGFNPITLIQNNEIAPSVYSLSQNYPNPFNPQTTITFVLPSSEFVTLKIYNSLGQEIIRLLSENKETGTHSIKFNGLSLSSGVYYYKLIAGNFVQSKKMLLLK